jgi:hypothetical protein
MNRMTKAERDDLSYPPWGIMRLNRLPAIETMMPVLDVMRIQEKLADRARRMPEYHGPRLIES